MPQLPPIDPKRLAIDRRLAERRRDGRFRHDRVRRGFAFVAEEGAAVGARHEPADLPIMLLAERAARAPLGVQIGRHTPAKQVLTLTRLPRWQSDDGREIVEPRSARRPNEAEKGGPQPGQGRSWRLADGLNSLERNKVSLPTACGRWPIRQSTSPRRTKQEQPLKSVALLPPETFPPCSTHPKSPGPALPRYTRP